MIQAMSSIPLPESLAVKALAMFDGLVAEGRLHYTQTTPEIHTHNNFTFEFRTSPALLNKPVLPANAPERNGHGGPFLNPDPAFVVAAAGPDHVLELNLHSMLRPAFVLHTRLFRSQTEDLDLGDVRAARAVMDALGKGQMMIYNCGVAAGSSQGHKHMQVFGVAEMELFPSNARSTDDIASRIPGVPHKHFVLRLPKGASPEKIHERLTRLVAAAREALRECDGGEALNVVLTDEWVCVIPRRHAGRGRTGANGAGMVGMVWLKDQAERDSWATYGYTEHLAYVGVPIDGFSSAAEAEGL